MRIESQSDSPSPEREKGTAKWFNANKGYGFIERDAGEDIFVHYNDISGVRYRTLSQGERVEYAVRRTGKGLQAVDVVVVDE